MARASGRQSASPPRSEIYHAIKANPGITVTELAEQVQLGWGSVYHHLKKLRAAGQLRSRRVGKRRLLYVSDAKSIPKRPLALGATAKAVASCIVRNPGGSIKDVMDELGLSPRMTYYHVEKLVEARLVTAGSRTRYVDLKPTARLFQTLGLSQGKRRKAR